MANASTQGWAGEPGAATVLPPSVVAAIERGRLMPTKRILVVDDEEDGAEMLAELLRELGYHCQVALSGAAALATARAYRPHIVLLDVSMPSMDGYAVVQRLRLDPTLQGAAIAALTGWSGMERERQAVAAGFDCQLVKPVEIAALRKWLDAVRPSYD